MKVTIISDIPLSRKKEERNGGGGCKFDRST